MCVSVYTLKFRKPKRPGKRMSETETTVVEVIAKSSPPVVVSGLALGGVSLSEWVLLATLLYTLLATFFLIRDKAYRPWMDKRRKQFKPRKLGG